MASTQRTGLNQVRVAQNGTLEIRLALVVLNEQGDVAEQHWHRTSLPPGVDPREQLMAVNAHLALMGRATFDLQGSEYQRLLAVVAKEHTQEQITAYHTTIRQ